MGRYLPIALRRLRASRALNYRDFNFPLTNTTMNKDNAKDFLPLVQALADGKTIQIFSQLRMVWENIKDGENLEFSLAHKDYRIKPEPREWKAVVIVNCRENRNLGLTAGNLAGYDPGDEDLSRYNVIRVREILD